MVSTDVPFTILFIIFYFSTLSVTHMLQSMNYLYCFLLRVIKINCVYFCTLTGCIRVDVSKSLPFEIHYNQAPIFHSITRLPPLLQTTVYSGLEKSKSSRNVVYKKKDE